MVTLDEALKTANNAVLLAINAVAVLTSSVCITIPSPTPKEQTAFIPFVHVQKGGYVIDFSYICITFLP